MGDLQLTSYDPQGWSFTFNVNGYDCYGNNPSLNEEGINDSIGDS